MIKFIDIYKEGKKSGMILSDLNFSIERGKITVIAGQDGSGKSSIIDLIFGVTKAESGDIYILEKNIKHIKRKDLHKAFGYIDSDDDLFAHMTVMQNIAIPLYIENMDLEDVEDRVDIVLDLLGMKYEDYARKYPNELTQYEKQKVRIARAISSDPHVFIMDEPFAHLEEQVSNNLIHDILRIQEKQKMTIVYTTSKVSSALKMGDKIAILKNGRIIQFDEPSEILKNPKSEYVEYFVGKHRLIKKAEMLVAKDVMNKKVATVHMRQNFCQAMQIMRNQNENILVVVDVKDEGNIAVPIGIVSPKQIERAFNHNLTIGQVMRRDIKTIDENMSVSQVLEFRDRFKHYNLPVVDKNKALIGIITERSILNVQSDFSPDIEEIR